MPSVPLHLPPADRQNFPSNPLPQILQTPSGLAILELQGTIHFPAPDPSSEHHSTLIGRLVFPNYSKDDPSKSTWTGIVHFYVGRHQRLTGEVKKLTNPIAVIRRKPVEQCMEDGRESREELEIVEIVYHKILFSSRPEPVGDNSILSV